MNSLDHVLEPLLRIPGVRGALLVDAADGVVVAAEMLDQTAAPKVAAFVAALQRRIDRAVQTVGLGEAAFLQLDAARGRICAFGRGGLVLIVLAELETNVGLMRAELRRAAERLP